MLLFAIAPVPAAAWAGSHVIPLEPSSRVFSLEISIKHVFSVSGKGIHAHNESYPSEVPLYSVGEYPYTNEEVFPDVLPPKIVSSMFSKPPDALATFAEKLIEIIKARDHLHPGSLYLLKRDFDSFGEEKNLAMQVVTNLHFRHSMAKEPMGELTQDEVLGMRGRIEVQSHKLVAQVWKELVALQADGPFKVRALMQMAREVSGLLKKYTSVGGGWTTFGLIGYRTEDGTHIFQQATPFPQAKTLVIEPDGTVRRFEMNNLRGRTSIRLPLSNAIEGNFTPPTTDVGSDGSE